MLRRLAPFLSLALLVSAQPPVRVDLAALFDPGEVECLLRAPEPGVRWTWDGRWCVGVLTGAVGAPAPSAGGSR